MRPYRPRRLPCLMLLLVGWVSAAAAEPFTLAVVPDVQQEVLNDKDTRLRDRFQWLVDQREALDLKMVLQVGDLCNWDTPDHIQYERARAAVTVLDQAALPYVLAIGNHDTAATKEGGSAAPGNVHDNLRNTTTFNTYFPTTRFTALGGVFEPNKIDNAWHTFRAGGLDWLVLNLELWPRAEAVTWACGVVEAHPHHNIIVLTHSFLNGAGEIEQRNGGYGDNSPQYLFDRLIAPYANVRMLFCGHTGRARLRTLEGNHGNPIHVFVQTYHDNQTNPVRLITIDPAAGTMRSRVHCPSLGSDKDDGSTFEISEERWVPAAE